MTDRPQFTVETAQLPEQRVVVAVSGEIDLYTAPRLQEALDGVIEAGVTQIVVDLSDTSFIDSSGLGALIAESKRLKAQSGPLAIACPNEQVRRVLQITGLDQVFALYDSREDALAGSVRP